MKKIFSTILLCLLGNAYAGEISSYNQITEAVNQGKPVRIVVKFENCEFFDKAGNALEHMPNIGNSYFAPQEILIDGEGAIRASMMHFTLNDPMVPNQPVYQFLRYTITSDEVVHLVSNSLNAKTYTPMSELYINCKLKTDANVFD